MCILPSKHLQLSSRAIYISKYLGFPSGTSGNELACKYRRHETQIGSLGWKIPWRRAWQSTPVFLPEESYGQRSVAGYSPWGHRELDMTE